MRAVILLIVAALLVTGSKPERPRATERLDRGVVAVKVDSGVFVSWRLLGDDAAGIAFNVYRDGQRVNSSPLDGATCLVDGEGTTASVYTVRSVTGGREGKASRETRPWKTPYLAVALDRPTGAEGYLPNDCSVGDLDGDGAYEIVVKWNARAKDNSQTGVTDPVLLDAYRLDGTRLWRVDLGVNIRAGAHYTQFIVYDLDGDGRAEMACKTAPGTRDGRGKAVVMEGDDSLAVYRDEAGFVLDGPEYLTVFDGRTGEEVTTVAYEPPRGERRGEAWGDPRGNRVDRFLACVAYLDGQRPSLVTCRGYYTRAVLAAYDFDGRRLARRWVYDSDTSEDARGTARGQGNHSVAAGDVDGDGRDEIVYGAACIDDDGRLLYSTGLGHGDAHHLSDMDPERPGLEFFDVHETRPCPAGVELRDAGTGELLFGRPTTVDVGRGMAADVDARYRGFEFWSSASDSVYSITGKVISTRKPSVNFRVYWDGDVQDELLDGTRIEKWDGEKAALVVDFATFGARSINGSKKNPCLSADVFGDWREEVVFYDGNDPGRLLIFTTTIPTRSRLPTLMHDHVYRLAVAAQNVGYNQPPHLGVYIGE
ncbi:MAG: rhamnogalacturonan lyase [Odoribacteraceae bacterium]|jgi:rhamnogalacturonan endolyase|nr:rhamnogalacturonan lyase [Odoribacteraceae bacterium]